MGARAWGIVILIVVVGIGVLGLYSWGGTMRSSFSEAELEEQGNKALNWLREQHDPWVYSLGIEFLDVYEDDYTGRLEGRVDVDTFILNNNETLEEHLADLEVWIFSGTSSSLHILDSELSEEPLQAELQEKVSISRDGSFETVGSVEGEKIARIVDRGTGAILGTTEVQRYDLIRSYSVPPDDPMMRTTIERKSWLYDNALAIISFSLAGDQQRAQSILSSLEELQNEDGSFGFAYDIYSGEIDSTKRSGSIAWLGDAVVKYESAFGDSSYRPMAESIAEFLLTQQDPETGSIKGGPDVDWYSTEHNIDSYFFFRDVASLTGNTEYADTARNISNALLSHHWNEDEGRFNQGINDPAGALDTNSWGSIFLHAIGRDDLAKSATYYLENFKVIEATMNLGEKDSSYNMMYHTDASLTGYKPYAEGYESPPSIVWTEGTWGVINLLLRQGEPVDDLLNSMFTMQNADSEGGVVYSNERKADSTYSFYVWPAVASTSWQYITLKNPRAIWDDKQ